MHPEPARAPVHPHPISARTPRSRLTDRHRRWTYGACLGVLATGALWLLAHYLLRGDCEFGECRSPLEPWILRLHGAAAFVALVQFGTLLPVHVARAWRAGRNRAAGAVVLAGAGSLIASGYGLYYVASETLRPPLSLLHWILGLVLVPLFAAHLRLGRNAGLQALDDHRQAAHLLHGRHADPAGARKKSRRHSGR